MSAWGRKRTVAFQVLQHTESVQQHGCSLEAASIVRQLFVGHEKGSGVFICLIAPGSTPPLFLSHP